MKGKTLMRFWCAMALLCGLVSSAVMLIFGLDIGLIVLWSLEAVLAITMCVVGTGREGLTRKATGNDSN